MSRHPIRDILAQRQRTAVWLAEQTGFSRAHVYNVLSGQSPSSRRLERACRLVLEVGDDVPLFSDEVNAEARRRVEERIARRKTRKAA